MLPHLSESNKKSPDCEGMNSRVFLKKSKRAKIEILKIALELKPYIQGRRKLQESVSRSFSDRKSVGSIILCYSFYVCLAKEP